MDTAPDPTRPDDVSVELQLNPADPHLVADAVAHTVLALEAGASEVRCEAADRSVRRAAHVVAALQQVRSATTDSGSDGTPT